MLEHAYGVTPEKLYEWTGRRRPTAHRWYDFATSERAAQIVDRVAKLADVRPGDVILIKYPPTDLDTGHVMLIAGRPVRRTASEPLGEGTQQWEIPVIDSSKSAHGPQDTRRRASGEAGAGLGKGVVRVYTHSDDAVAGYAWSTQKSARFQPVTEHPLVIVRFKLQPAN